jgi:hypothetical protein
MARHHFELDDELDTTTATAAVTEYVPQYARQQHGPVQNWRRGDCQPPRQATTVQSIAPTHLNQGACPALGNSPSRGNDLADGGGGDGDSIGGSSSVSVNGAIIATPGARRTSTRGRSVWGRESVFNIAGMWGISMIDAAELLESVEDAEKHTVAATPTTVPAGTSEPTHTPPLVLLPTQNVDAASGLNRWWSDARSDAQSTAQSGAAGSGAAGSDAGDNAGSDVGADAGLSDGLTLGVSLKYTPRFKPVQPTASPRTNRLRGWWCFSDSPVVSTAALRPLAGGAGRASRRSRASSAV